MKVSLEINSCQDCPFFSKERYYTEDSFEHAYNCHCNNTVKTKIQGFVEWHEEKSIQIPEWCPAKESENWPT